MGSLFSPPKPAAPVIVQNAPPTPAQLPAPPPPPEPAPLPDPGDQRARALSRRQAALRSRSGRQSTILSDAETLG